MPIRGLRAEAYRTGRAVYHNDFSKTEWAGLMPKGHVSLDNVLFAPLTVEGTVIGLLGLANKTGGFSENDVRMASAFGELAAVALHNSRTLEALEESEKRVRSIVDSAKDAIISCTGGCVASWNRAAQTMFGYSADEILGKPVTLIMPERYRDPHRGAMERLASTGKPTMLGRTVELVGLTKDGKEFPLEMTYSSWKVGEQTYYTSIIRDITERKQMEEMRDRFISAVTHELRTPLVPLVAHVDYALAGKLGPIPEKVESSLEVMKRSTDRLLGLTDELLDIRRIESGKFELNLEPLNFREVIDQTLKEMQTSVDMKKQSLHVEVPAGPLPTRGDRARLSQVLVNILSNASKFTPDNGRITIKVEEDEDAIKVQVSDTGIGIRREDLERVFEPFAAIHKPAYIKGTGLGLSIAKGLVEAHGGRIWAESTGEGGGATFTFTLPKLREEG
jgi:PAS domain S-box-containing protein